jgi:peptidoglycan/LPS O-acetylase OafA/YrhL
LLRLRRITSGATWIPQIDGLRFLAIAAVLLVHSLGEVTHQGQKLPVLPPGAHWILDLLQNGGRGVQLFFVISGYILARPFLRQHRLGGPAVKLRSYFLRRVTRLEPPYILSLLIYTAALYLAFHPSFHTMLPHLLASMGYVHGLFYYTGSTINFVTWSLEIEIQFYILAPLLANLYRIKNTVLRRGIIAALILFFCFVNSRPIPFIGYDLTPLFYMHYFLAGFLLTDLLEYPRHTSRQTWAWDVVSLVGWPAIFLMGNTGKAPTWLVLLILPVYLAAFYGKASNWFFRQSFVALTGGMCYSIYLMHMLIISTSFHAIKHLQMPGVAATMAVQMILLIAIALLLSAVYFVLIERPCMDPEWPQKLWRKVLRLEGKKTARTTAP